MKIGILTLHHALNAGAVLQAWALQTYLQKNGYAAKVVNYGKIGWPFKYSLNFANLRRFAGSCYYGCRTFFLTFGVETYRRRLFRDFLYSIMRVDRPAKKRDVLGSECTHFIVGSDQIWNPRIVKKEDVYFLPNVKNGVKRIAYAGSFGIDEFSPQQVRLMQDCFKNFDALSVREEQGAQIIKRLCGREAEVVCDPTLLLPADAYTRIERQPALTSLPSRYVAIYTVGGHPLAKDMACRIGARLGIPVVHLCGGQLARWYWPRGEVKYITALGPREWLCFMHHADYVVTNSFHGVIFSLLFHRPFTALLNNRPGDARLLTLLDAVGLKRRAASCPNDEGLTDSVDWAIVDRNIEEFSKKGKSFLSKALAK